MELKTTPSDWQDFASLALVLALIALSLGGCASVDPFAHDAVARSQDFNAWWGAQ